VLDAATAGSVLCLTQGEYAGPIDIRSAVVLTGPRDAVIRSAGQDSTVRVDAAGAQLRGFSVDGSGTRFDTTDAAVRVLGDDVVVDGLTVRGALFGIIAERSSRVVVTGNRIVGDAATSDGLRGDGIRFWEVHGGRIESNLMEDSRDVAVWYSPGTRVAHNTVRRSRYGAHFMYSSDSIVEHNDYQTNVVGVFIMYSRGIAVRDNRIGDNTSPDGMGLGAKDSGDLAIERNRFTGDRQCLYIDNSPSGEGQTLTARDNVFASCAAAVTFHRSETRTTFADNRFEVNDVVVVVEGRGTALGVSWHGNYFDDYQGYDMDRDGYGDVPYEVRDLSERLIAGHPLMALFRGTIALGLVDLAGRTFPLLQPATLLSDPLPRMSPPAGSR
jgi:nitrous oxidase accessory protein